jgi:hypothetical protein
MSTGFSGAPAPMEGGGTYNRNSRVQQAGASPASVTLGWSSWAVQWP